MIQAIFIPQSQREEQGPAQKIKRLYWRFSWKNFSTGSLVLVLRQRTVGALLGRSDWDSSWPSSLCLPLPSTVNPVPCESTLTDSHSHVNEWLSIPQILLRTGCLPPSLRMTPGFPDSAKHTSSSLTLCLLLARTVFAFIISSRKGCWAGRSGNTQQTTFFQLSYGVDSVMWLLWRLSEAQQYVWERITSYIPRFLHISLNECQGYGRQR